MVYNPSTPENSTSQLPNLDGPAPYIKLEDTHPLQPHEVTGKPLDELSPRQVSEIMVDIFKKRAKADANYTGHADCAADVMSSLNKVLDDQADIFYEPLSIAPAYSAEDRQMGRINLSVASHELMDKVYKLTGAVKVRDDLVDGEEFGFRIWHGMYFDKPVNFVEEYMPVTRSHDEFMSWSLMDDSKAEARNRQLSEKDMKYLYEESGMDKDTVDDLIRRHSINRESLTDRVDMHRHISTWVHGLPEVPEQPRAA
jgi:hypothetical protein